MASLGLLSSDIEPRQLRRGASPDFECVQFLSLPSNGRAGGVRSLAEKRDRGIHSESGLTVVSFCARPDQPKKPTQTQLGFALALGVASPAPARAGEHRTSAS
jgi:hypothetical protein